MNIHKRFLFVLTCFVSFACTKYEGKINTSINLLYYNDLSFELIDKYNHPNYNSHEYYIGYADILSDGSILFDVSKDGSGKYIDMFVYKTLTDKLTVDFNKKEAIECSFININGILHIINSDNDIEYIIDKSIERMKRVSIARKRTLIRNVYLLYKDYNCSIVNGNEILFGDEGNNSFVVPTKFIVVNNNEVLFMYVREDVGYNSNRELIKLDSDGNYTVINKNIRDFTKIGKYLLCLDSFPPPDVPHITQEEAYEEYSINVYDLDGKLIKNLDKELYDKYGMLAFPDSISVNSSGYGVMSGSFVFNYGKEGEYDFRGLIIFKLVESK